MDKQYRNILAVSITASVIISSVFGAAMGFWSASFTGAGFNLTSFLRGGAQETAIGGQNNALSQKVVKVEEESAVINTVENVSPAVVSIIVTKDLPVLEKYYSEPFGSDFFNRFFGEDFGDFFGFGVPRYRQNGTEKREVGGGTGFIASPEGHIITNKHVVSDEEADYTVLMNDEEKFEAKVLARDSLNDLAILKIEASPEGKEFPFIQFGDSGGLKVGQSVIAIGNALGEFRNTVSTGVISGLSRSVIAGGAGLGSEQLTNVIQTDASINPGNSGGPLLNLSGQVIGINTAIAQGAQNIGFAIPVNEVKNIYESVKEHGRIVRPWLGVRYIPINETIAEKNNLSVDYGVLIVRGESRTDLAVIPGSPADKAGIEENDIILELDGKKIDSENLFNKMISGYSPGDEIRLKILHKGEEKEIKVKLEEMDN